MAAMGGGLPNDKVMPTDDTVMPTDDKVIPTDSQWVSIESRASMRRGIG